MMGYRMLIALSLSFIMLLASCVGEIENTFNWEIDDFESINHEGKQTRLSDFGGNILIVDFIFTKCATVCIPMTANMTELQEKLKDEKLNAELISISVDPEVDTPEMLKEYVLGYGGDLSNWTLLTGFSQEFIGNYAYHNFKTAVKKPEDDSQVVHGSSFFLVNQEGKVIKKYSGLAVPYDEIIHDVKILTREG